MTKIREGGRRRGARVLSGLPASSGIAIGRALMLDRGNLQIFRADLDAEQAEAEVARLEAAVELTRSQLNEIRGSLQERSGDEYAFIFDAHLLLLEDRHLVPEAIETVKREKVNAEWALDQAARKIEKVFAGIDDPYLKERAHDIADVHERVQRNLAGSEPHDLSELTEDVILVAHSLPPSQVAGLQHEHVVGFVTEVGGPTGHIVCRFAIIRLYCFVCLQKPYFCRNTPLQGWISSFRYQKQWRCESHVYIQKNSMCKLCVAFHPV